LVLTRSERNACWWHTNKQTKMSFFQD
jgi:hypothetical protein